MGLTQADLARKHGISRARVNQWLALLKLPEGERRLLESMRTSYQESWKIGSSARSSESTTLISLRLKLQSSELRHLILPILRELLS